MDVHTTLEELTRLVEEARAVPMSTSALVNRSEVLSLLAELRDQLPEELHHADLVLADREAVVAEGRAEAVRVLAEARGEAARLVEETEVVARARALAREVTEGAEVEAARLLAEADDYVDRKLAEFEIVLERTAAQVSHGRDRLAGRRAADLATLPHADLLEGAES